MLVPLLLSAVVALAPGATTTPTPTPTTPATTTTAPAAPDIDLCGLLNLNTLDVARSTGGLQTIIPAGLPSWAIISAGRTLAGCTGAPATPDHAQVVATLCADLNVDSLNGLADRLAATPGVRGNITPANIAAARSALACDTPTTITTPATTSAAATTTPSTTQLVIPTTTPAGGGGQVSRVPVGAANTGSGPGDGPGPLAGDLAALALLAGVSAVAVGAVRRRRW